MRPTSEVHDARLVGVDLDRLDSGEVRAQLGFVERLLLQQLLRTVQQEIAVALENRNGSFEGTVDDLTS